MQKSDSVIDEEKKLPILKFSQYLIMLFMTVEGNLITSLQRTIKSSPWLFFNFSLPTLLKVVSIQTYPLPVHFLHKKMWTRNFENHVIWMKVKNMWILLFERKNLISKNAAKNAIQFETNINVIKNSSLEMKNFQAWLSANSKDYSKQLLNGWVIMTN